MKPLDKNKKYDLSQLNNEQLQAVLDWLKENDTGWYNYRFSSFKKENNLYCLFYDEVKKDWRFKKHRVNLTNALEFFEEETHLLTAQDFVNASKGLAQIGVGLKEISHNLNSISKTINDKMSLESDIKSLIEKGKKHGLKIVVTFEKL